MILLAAIYSMATAIEYINAFIACLLLGEGITAGKSRAAAIDLS